MLTVHGVYELIIAGNLTSYTPLLEESLQSSIQLPSGAVLTVYVKSSHVYSRHFQGFHSYLFSSATVETFQLFLSPLLMFSIISYQFVLNIFCIFGRYLQTQVHMEHKYIWTCTVPIIVLRGRHILHFGTHVCPHIK